jgi:hypothetical protein
MEETNIEIEMMADIAASGMTTESIESAKTETGMLDLMIVFMTTMKLLLHDEPQDRMPVAIQHPQEVITEDVGRSVLDLEGALARSYSRIEEIRAVGG